MRLTIILTSVQLKLMYVCICHAVTDRTIRACAEQGVRTLRQLREATGCASGCGRCAPEAKALLEACAELRSEPARSDRLPLTPAFA